MAGSDRRHVFLPLEEQKLLQNEKTQTPKIEEHGGQVYPDTAIPKDVSYGCTHHVIICNVVQ